MATSPWKGDITLDPDSQGVTIIDKAATTNLRAGGTSTFAQTAEQVKGAAEWKALLNAQLAKLTAQAAASGDGPAVGAGIGTAAMGLGMMMR
jgi:hypothetical protein